MLVLRWLIYFHRVFGVLEDRACAKDLKGFLFGGGWTFYTILMCGFRY